MKSRNKCGYKGVHRRKGKNSAGGTYYIQVWKDGKLVNIKKITMQQYWMRPKL